MSQYIQFFIKSNSNEFLPIGVFSRCNAIYGFFEEYFNAPYEKIAAITMQDLTYLVRKIDDCIKIHNDRIVELEQKIKTITEYNNSVKEKMLAIDDVNSVIKEYVRERDEFKWARDYVCSLQEIIDAIAYDDKYCKDTYLYCGIEVGNNLSINDITDQKQNREKVRRGAHGIPRFGTKNPH